MNDEEMLNKACAFTVFALGMLCVAFTVALMVHLAVKLFA